MAWTLPGWKTLRRGCLNLVQRSAFAEMKRADDVINPLGILAGHAEDHDMLNPVDTE
jgi:hypothetical protein